MMIQIPAEIASKIAMTFRGTPALLAMLLINLLFMGMIVWALWVQAEYRHKEHLEMLRLVDRCRTGNPA
jgi:hypothetical protein